jgi:hypothetical protein
MKPGARYIRSMYIKLGHESALVTLCLEEHFHCIWECSCGMRGGRSEGMTADQTTVACRESYKEHCASTHPNACGATASTKKQALDQVTIRWLGGVWDGVSLDASYETAITLLGADYRCSSNGAPFSILEKLDALSRTVVTYRADAELSKNGVLYLRVLALAAH